MKSASVLALGLLTSVGVLAQSSVHLQGKVIGPKGAPVQDAQVNLMDTTAGTGNMTFTDKKGKYELNFAPRRGDTYTLAAKKAELLSEAQPVNPKHADQKMDFTLGATNTLPTNQPSAYTSSENVLQSGTPVTLVLQENLSSADATLGQEVVFRVVDDVVVNGYLVIAHGALAKGTVTEAQAKRRMGRAGKLNVNIDYADMTDGEHAALRAVKNSTGGGHGTAVTTGVVATALVFWPAAPLFLLMHGKDIAVPKGTQITAFVNGDIRLQTAKFTKLNAGM